MGVLNLRKHGILAVTVPLALVIVIFSFTSSYFLKLDPYKLDVMQMLEGPNDNHIFGTDELGRDVFARTIHAARISITVGFISVFIGAVGGVIIGVISAFKGGFVDFLLMRFMEVVFCFPAILLAIILMANLGTNIINAMLAIGIIFIPGFARLTRATTYNVLKEQYIDSAICLGIPKIKIIFREILPNIIAPIVVEAAVAFSYAILLESSLSFLGLGAQPPEPTWGNMINTGRGFIENAPWITLVPGITLFVCVLIFNLIGDGLRDALDPNLD